MFGKINKRTNDLFFSKRNYEWKDNEYFDSDWKVRINHMSQLINRNTSSVADIGCGKSWLKDFLPPNTDYYGIDYIKRNDETIVCDLNNKEFTSLSFDTCFCSGIIEYIEENNIEWFFSTLRNQTNYLIVSYCSLDLNSSLRNRKKLFWKNHFSKIQLIDLIESCGFELVFEASHIQGNNVFSFKVSGE